MVQCKGCCGFIKKKNAQKVPLVVEYAVDPAGNPSNESRGSNTSNQSFGAKFIVVDELNNIVTVENDGIECSICTENVIEDDAAFTRLDCH